MALEKHLDDLRNAVPGCRLAAYGDTSARLILRSSAAETFRREILDQLCAEAADAFDLNARATAPDGQAADVLGQAILSFDAAGTRIFARQGRESTEVVCALLSSAQVTSDDLPAVQACVRSIADDAS